MKYKTLEDFVGNTPLVRLQRIPGDDNARRGNVILAKLEGNNPAGSVKDRPALSMIRRAEERGDIKPGDTLIEATSGNTGIALAMVAAVRGYRMILVMPENQSIERRQSMAAYGAELVLTSKAGSMELARDVAEKLRDEGRGIILDQFANPIIRVPTSKVPARRSGATPSGEVTHFVSSMGTTGTIMGTSTYLKSMNPACRSSAASRKRIADPGYPEVARGLSAEDLRRQARRSHRIRGAGCSGGHDAPTRQ
jgi:cysteine synthase B